MNVKAQKLLFIAFRTFPPFKRSDSHQLFKVSVEYRVCRKPTFMSNIRNWHESVAKYKKNGGTEQLKKFDYTSYDDNVPYYTMIIREDGRKIKLLLDLTEEMLHTIKTQHPEKVYFA